MYQATVERLLSDMVAYGGSARCWKSKLPRSNKLIRLGLENSVTCFSPESTNCLSVCTGGICWATMVRHGRCTELLEEKTSKEDCCASSGVATAWSPDDLEAGTLFFWRALGGGVPCNPCKGEISL